MLGLHQVPTYTIIPQDERSSMLSLKAFLNESVRDQHICRRIVMRYMMAKSNQFGVYGNKYLVSSLHNGSIASRNPTHNEI
jgi:hypothetical protein